jgi:hypothetical protein
MQSIERKKTMERDYKGYTIVETDCTYEHRDSLGRKYITKVYKVVRPLHYTPDSEIFTTIQQCKDYINYLRD